MLTASRSSKTASAARAALDRNLWFLGSPEHVSAQPSLRIGRNSDRHQYFIDRHGRFMIVAQSQVEGIEACFHKNNNSVADFIGQQHGLGLVERSSRQQRHPDLQVPVADERLVAQRIAAGVSNREDIDLHQPLIVPDF